MTPERFQQVDQLISLVLEQEPSGRRAFLDKACSGDRELREEVESLLAADEGAGNFLSKPAAPLVAALRDDDSKLKLGPKQGDAAAAPPVSAVGRYVVLGELGGGGMGLVYAAYDPELDRKVAIKLMRPEASAAISPSKGRERLLREAQAMAQLMHPNVIAIHDVGTFGDQVFIAMEYGEGSTLTDWLAAEKRTWPEIVSLFVQAGRGLAAAHAKGILHRDFKPDNVWVGEDGRARVLDFGLARATRTSNGEDLQLPGAQPSDEKKLSPRVAMLGVPVTEPGKFLGTPAYMAPEQLVGELGDARADQFSFCVALYQGLYGELPYVGETVAALLDEMKHHSIREAPKSSRVPSWLRRVLLRGLSPNRADRYESMDRLLDKLARRPFLTRRRSLTLGILAVLVLLVVASSVAWQKRNAASGRIHSIAVLPLENLTRDSSQEYFVDGVTDALITNLAQLSTVSVISRGSIMRYKNGRTPVAQIAKELSVDAVVKGSVVRSGTLVRIDAQLLRAATNRQIWARSYQHDLSDIVRLQTEVAGAIVSEIEAKVTPK